MRRRRRVPSFRKRLVARCRVLCPWRRESSSTRSRQGRVQRVLMRRPRARLPPTRTRILSRGRGRALAWSLAEPAVPPQIGTVPLGGDDVIWRTAWTKADPEGLGLPSRLYIPNQSSSSELFCSLVTHEYGISRKMLQSERGRSRTSALRSAPRSASEVRVVVQPTSVISSGTPP